MNRSERRPVVSLPMTVAGHADLPSGVRRILVVEAGPIDPETNAGDRACADLLEGLVAIGAEVRFHGLGSRGNADARLLPAMRSRNPQIEFSLNETDLAVVLDQERFDAVIVSRPGAAVLCGPALAAKPELVRVFWGHDLHSRRLAAQQSTRGDLGERRASLMAMVEARNWEIFDLSVYPASNEVEVVNELVPGNGVACPYYRLRDVDLAAASPERNLGLHERLGILMVGSHLHAPNADAVDWTVNEILPLIRADHPEVSLTVVGDWSRSDRQMWERPGVRFTGVVSEEDLRRLHHEHVCLLAPLRFGGGTKRKVVAAMGLGLPVVTTDEGQRGVLVRDGRGQPDGISLGNDPDSLASAVRRLHSDGEFWSRMSTAARNAVAQVYGSGAFDQALSDILSRAVANRDQRLRSSQDAGAVLLPPPSQAGA